MKKNPILFIDFKSLFILPLLILGFLSPTALAQKARSRVNLSQPGPGPKEVSKKNMDLGVAPPLECKEFDSNKALQEKMKSWNAIFTYKKTDAFVKAMNEFVKLHGILISYFGPSDLKFIASDTPCENIGFRFAKTLPLKDETGKKNLYVRFVENYRIKKKWTLPSVEMPETFLGATDEAAYFRYEAVQLCNECIKTKFKCESSSKEVALKVGKGGIFEVVSLAEVPGFKTVRERGDCPEELPEKFNSFCRSQKSDFSDQEGGGSGPDKLYMIPEPCI